MTLPAGSKLGPYLIQSQLGAGGMGEVYRARDTRLARDVAIKVLPSSYADDKDRLQRFEQEACAAGALNSSNESGRWEIYVQPYPTTGEKWRISSNGGQLASWRKDMKELFYITTEGRLMSADITTTPKFESSVARQLFQTNIKNLQQGLCYAATTDGQRFLVNTFVQSNNPAPMTIVLNWTGDLKR